MQRILFITKRVIMKEEWKKERNAVLNWWPIILSGPRPEGYMFIETLEEAAWGCQGEQDWHNWINQLETIWPKYTFLEPIHNKTSGEGIESHLGATLGQALLEAIHSDNQLIQLDTRANSPPPQQTSLSDVIALAEKLRNEFNFLEISTSKSSDTTWLKKQLMDAHLGFANIATVLDVPHSAIGGGTLRLSFHEKSTQRGAFLVSQQHLEIHQMGGNVSQAWAFWKMSSNPFADYSRTISKWRQSWNKDERIKLEHQKQFLIKTQNACKRLVELIPVTSEMGQKIFRRYRSLCKWIDDLHRGVSLEINQKSWEKLKTGNRIAWSGESNSEYRPIIKNWTIEERLIEKAFWKTPQWHVPAWVQRFRCLHQENVRSENGYNEKDYLELWALGFEGFMRNKMGYDGWSAMKKNSHPSNYEAQEFNTFLEEHLFPFLKNK